MGTREVHIGSWWGKTEGKRRTRKPGLRREDNITMGFNSFDWIGLAQVREKCRAFVDTVVKLQVS